MTTEAQNLPKSWILSSIGEIYQVIGGGTPSTLDSSYWDGDTPWITSADIGGVRDIAITRYVSSKGIENSATNRVPPRTLLVVTRVGLGKIAISGQEICFSQDLQGLVAPANMILPEFSLYYLSVELQKLKFEGRGTTISGVTKKQLKDTLFPLAPFKEQCRIVAKIEELFSELDKGVDALTTAREQLKVYRQAVLQYAFEGKLTAHWREHHCARLISPSAFMVRVKAELDKKYANALESWKLSLARWEERGGIGKRPVKPRKQEISSPPTHDEVSRFPSLPQSWQWIKLGQLVWSVKDGPHYSPKYATEGVPFISGGNIRPDGVDFNTAKFITPELHAELSERCKPEKGDLLYTKGGTTGIARVNTYEREFNVWVHVAVLKLAESVRPLYLQHVLNAPRCYIQSQKYTHGVGNQDLGLTRMVNIILPLCSDAEQERIELLIDEVTSEIAQVERTINDRLKQCEALRQSILKQAFSGQLVSQDLADEPASVLLERIRTERKNTAMKRPLRKKKKSKNEKEDAA